MNPELEADGSGFPHDPEALPRFLAVVFLEDPGSLVACVDIRFYGHRTTSTNHLGTGRKDVFPFQLREYL
jgi:hypothetical protein